MFRFFRKSKQSKHIFPEPQGPFLDATPSNESDAFFEDALGSYPTSAHESNRAFVGSVIGKNRFVLAIGIAVCILLIFVGKTSALQLWGGSQYRALAENNRIQTRILPAQRGILYDRNGEILAKNTPTFQITTSRSRLSEHNEHIEEALSHFSHMFDISESDLTSRVYEPETDQEEILLTDTLSHEQAVQFMAWQDQFPGMTLELGSRRQYITTDIPSLSHVLGYTGVVNEQEYEALRNTYRRFDHIGKFGIEQSYESELRGTFGEEILEVDALGRIERIVSKIDPIDGENVYLTLDAELQTFIEESIEQRLDGSEAARGSVVVMDPNDGAIRALVSWPAFDANLFTSGIDQGTYESLLFDEHQPLFPRAMSGEFPSGSTLKPVYAAAALTEEIIDEQTTVLSTGGIRIGPWFFPDWRAGGHGATDVYHAIADSVNTFFYIIGGGHDGFQGLGVETLMQYADLFGFGKQTGIDIAGEATGFLPSREWKESVKGEPWYIGDTYNVSIGQGDFLATPLQIAHSTAVFANGGFSVTPHIAQNASHTSMTQIIDEETARIIQEAMRRTVTYGSARSLDALAISAAGKTGTAQWSSVRPNHAWFTGFAPFERPEIVVTVLIEEGADDYLAVPIASDILQWWESNQSRVSE